MSEHAPRHEDLATPEIRSEKPVERHIPKAEHHAETAEAARQKIEEVRNSIEKESAKAKEVQLPKSEQEAMPTPSFVTRDLKAMARTRSLKHLRQQLPVTDRAFSKIIHQPIIDSVSEAAGKTIARPSGLLSGGIFALLGSSIFLYIDKHYGYRYNFLLWAVCFVGGFVVGLLIEFVISIYKRLHS